MHFEDLIWHEQACEWLKIGLEIGLAWIICFGVINLIKWIAKRAR